MNFYPRYFIMIFFISINKKKCNNNERNDTNKIVINNKITNIY